MILIIEANSKIYKPISYNKAVNNPIYDWHWYKAIKDKLQALENH